MIRGSFVEDAFPSKESDGSGSPNPWRVELIDGMIRVFYNDRQLGRLQKVELTAEMPLCTPILKLEVVASSHPAHTAPDRAPGEPKGKTE